jgi:hypothetical protein
MFIYIFSQLLMNPFTVLQIPFNLMWTYTCDIDQYLPQKVSCDHSPINSYKMLQMFIKLHLHNSDVT